MNKIFLIMGESGSGKDTIVNKLCADYGYKRIKSYTTRPSRRTAVDEQSHIFVTDEEFDKLDDLIAFTHFDQFRYGATASQADEADLYIVDPEGVRYFKEHYHGDREPYVIYIMADKADRFCWLKERYGGDAEATELAMHRIKHDELAFHRDVVRELTDETVRNSVYVDIDEVVEEVKEIMDEVNGDKPEYVTSMLEVDADEYQNTEN